MMKKRSYVFIAAFLLTSCNEFQIENDRKRVDEYFELFIGAVAPEIAGLSSKARRARCKQGTFFSSYQAYTHYPLRADVLGHDIDVDRYIGAAKEWLPQNDWTITKDYMRDTGTKRIIAINRNLEVDFSIGGHKKAFGISATGPCRTVVNWPD